MEVAIDMKECVPLESDRLESMIRSVIGTLGFADGGIELLRDSDLYNEGMSSHASVKLMLGLEDAFDIEFPDEMLERETFSSIEVISTSISRILADV